MEPTPGWDRRASRDLDSFEEFFHYMEAAAPALHVHVVSIEGSPPPEDWRAAWRSLHVDYPLLRFRIVKSAGRRPRFVETDRSARIEIDAAADDTGIAAEAERALARPFRDPERDLVALRIVPGPSGCLVSLASHHSLFDGMATLLLLQALLDRVSGAGPRQGRVPVWSSLREAVGAAPRSGYRNASPAADRLAPVGATAASPPVRVSHLALDASLTARIEAAARRHDTSPHGALMVALQIAGASARPAWAAEGVGCNTPQNVRGGAVDADATGMLTTAIVTTLPPVDEGRFWPAARAARESLRPGRSPEGRLGFVAAMDDLTADETTPDAFLGMIAQASLAYELMVTDYASYRPRSRYGALRIGAIATGPNGGGPDTQTIGVCTLDGAMNLTQIGLRPIDGLLERCREVLTTACA